MSLRIDKNNLHHAYLVVGDSSLAERGIIDFFATQGIVLLGSPDYFVFREKTFGIEDARKLSELALRKAFSSIGRKIFLLASETITTQAQNALLKTFEEPIDRTHFFLITRDQEMVIPTLLSRMQIISAGSRGEGREAEGYLSLPISKRIAFAKKFADDERNLPCFLDELLLVLRETGRREQVEEVYKMRLVSDRISSSPRLILEHLSLLL